MEASLGSGLCVHTGLYSQLLASGLSWLGRAEGAEVGIGAQEGQVAED